MRCAGNHPASRKCGLIDGTSESEVAEQHTVNSSVPAEYCPA